MSSRIEGFAIMDVSSSLHDDPKVKRLAREYPEQLGPGFLAYVATMGESWKAGQRLSVEDSWPSYLAYDATTVDALKAVKLLEDSGLVTVSAWRGYFVQARNRRKKSRDRWNRANAARRGEGASPNGKHSDVTARSQRGAHAVTAPPSDSDSVRPTEKKNHSPSARDEKKRTSGRQLSERAQALDARMIRDDDVDAPDWMRQPTEAKP